MKKAYYRATKSVNSVVFSFHEIGGGRASTLCVCVTHPRCVDSEDREGLNRFIEALTSFDEVYVENGTPLIILRSHAPEKADECIDYAKVKYLAAVDVSNEDEIQEQSDAFDLLTKETAEGVRAVAELLNKLIGG